MSEKRMSEDQFQSLGGDNALFSGGLQEDFAAAWEEAQRARESEKRLAEALWKLVARRHIHEAGPKDACRKCGKDIRDRVHFNVYESRETDMAAARAALSEVGHE